MEARLIIVVVLAFVAAANASFFEVRFPSVVVSAENQGNLTIEAGPQAGNIYLVPGTGGTVYVGHTDMLKLFQIVNSLPPVWGQKAPYGSLGSFQGGDVITIQLTAIDPEGGVLRFEKVSGALPPYVYLDKSTGVLNGTAPDVDATYEFGIRVIDTHGKYADQTFTIDTRERNQCSSNPCQNGGSCTDEYSTFSCSCPLGYGGRVCTTACESEAVGVAEGVKAIPDGQMSGHYAYSSSDHKAEEGRLDSSTGWIGEDTNSWLQIDFGNERYVYAVATQGYSSTYTLSTYQLTCSLDGNAFSAVPDVNGTAAIFQGSADQYTTSTKETLPVPQHCRYLRFVPLTWTSSHPGFRVEVYGCEDDV